MVVLYLLSIGIAWAVAPRASAHRRRSVGLQQPPELPFRGVVGRAARLAGGVDPDRLLLLALHLDDRRLPARIRAVRTESRIAGPSAPTASPCASPSTITELYVADPSACPSAGTRVAAGRYPRLHLFFRQNAKVSCGCCRCTGRERELRYRLCGRVTTQPAAEKRLCHVESDQLLSVRPPRLRHVVRAGRDLPPLRPLRQALVRLGGRSQGRTTRSRAPRWPPAAAARRRRA